MEITEEMQKRLAKALDWIKQHQDDTQEELHAQFSALAQQYNEQITGLDDAQFDFKPSDKDWSVREVSLHVSHSMRGGARAIKILAGGTTLPDDVAPGVLDEDPGDQAKIVAAVDRELQAVLDAMSCFDGTENLEATFKHPFFGPLQSRQLAAFNILHLTIHVKQVQRVKAHEAFPG